MKRRRLDLGELMVKTTSSAKPIPDKPVKHFRSVRRPEITRLIENDPMPPPTASKSLGRAKAGRPLVSDLAQTRANEALLKQQLTEERQKHDAFRQEESRRTAKTRTFRLHLAVQLYRSQPKHYNRGQCLQKHN